MSPARDTLPADLDSLKALAHAQQARIAHLLDEKQALLDEHRVEIDEHQAEIQRLREQLNVLLAKRFGRSSEQVPREQLGLFNEAEAESCAQAETAPEQSVSVPAHTRAKAGRRALPEFLPRVEVLHDLPEQDKQCPCGCGPMTRIGQESTEQLDIIPAKVQVIRHIRPKYACRRCEGAGVKLAPLPPQPIARSIASPGLLAYVASAKYVDGLPLHRIERILQRMGVDIARATLATWMVRVGTDLIQALVNLMRECLLKGPLVQMDETTVQVLKEPDKPPTSTSYMWVQRGGPPGIDIVLLHYAATRSGQVAKDLLSGYTGYLQVDGYEGYNAVCANEGIVRVGCLAHARRKFDEAIKAQGKAAQARTGKAHQGLAFIGQLYRIEREIRDMGAEQRRQRRDTDARGIMAQMQSWLEKSLPQVPPRSATGKALAYLHGQWDTLVRYLDDPRLPIDNNGAENAIRPFVIGRKGWLFADTVHGAQASANLYSLVETAKANGHEPYRYLRHVFTELPKAKTVQQVAALLPYNLDPDSI